MKVAHHHSGEHGQPQRPRTHSCGNTGLPGGFPALQGRLGLRLRSPAARGPGRETHRRLVPDETGTLREPHRAHHPGRVPLHYRQPGGFPRNRECSTSDAAHNPDVVRPAHPRTRAPGGSPADSPAAAPGIASGGATNGVTVTPGRLRETHSQMPCPTGWPSGRRSATTATPRQAAGRGAEARLSSKCGCRPSDLLRGKKVQHGSDNSARRSVTCPTDLWPS